MRRPLNSKNIDCEEVGCERKATTDYRWCNGLGIEMGAFLCDECCDVGQARLHQRRVGVQGDGPWRLPDEHPAKRDTNVPGTITWEEYLTAYSAYSDTYGTMQSAERIIERGGFSYNELVDLLGHEPKTWKPRTEEE